MNLVIGYGNTLLKDDGVGIAIAHELLREKIPNLKIILRQQLEIELIEEFSQYNTVIFVDASSKEKLPFSLRKLNANNLSDFPLTHHITPELLVELALR